MVTVSNVIGAVRHVLLAVLKNKNKNYDKECFMTSYLSCRFLMISGGTEVKIYSNSLDDRTKI